jgi:hypothetical protein
MNQLFVLYAGTTYPAGVVSLFAGAVDKLCVGDGQRNFLAILRSKEQLCMTHALIKDCLNQFAFNLLIPGNLTELHLIRIQCVVPRRWHDVEVTNLADFPDSETANSSPAYFRAVEERLHCQKISGTVSAERSVGDKEGSGTSETERTVYFSTFFFLPEKQTFELSSTSLKRIIVAMAIFLSMFVYFDCFNGPAGKYSQ